MVLGCGGILHREEFWRKHELRGFALANEWLAEEIYHGHSAEPFERNCRDTTSRGTGRMCSCFVVFRLQRGRLAVSRSGSQGKGIVDDLIDGVDRLALAAAATNIEDPGDEMVVDV
jgi:hypothetical protein